MRVQQQARQQRRLLFRFGNFPTGGHVPVQDVAHDPSFRAQVLRGDFGMGRLAGPNTATGRPRRVMVDGLAKLLDLAQRCGHLTDCSRHGGSPVRGESAHFGHVLRKPAGQRGHDDGAEQKSTTRRHLLVRIPPR